MNKIEKIPMNYQIERLGKADKAIKKVRALSEIFCPTDAWLSEARAIKANQAWQDYSSSLDKIGVAIARETVELSQAAIKAKREKRRLK